MNNHCLSNFDTNNLENRTSANQKLVTDTSDLNKNAQKKTQEGKE